MGTYADPLADWFDRHPPNRRTDIREYWDYTIDGQTVTLEKWATWGKSRDRDRQATDWRIVWTATIDGVQVGSSDCDWIAYEHARARILRIPYAYHPTELNPRYWRNRRDVHVVTTEMQANLTRDRYSRGDPAESDTP